MRPRRHRSAIVPQMMRHLITAAIGGVLLVACGKDADTSATPATPPSADAPADAQPKADRQLTLTYFNVDG